MTKKIIKKKNHVEIHGLSADNKATLVRMGIPMSVMATGAILLPLNIGVGSALIFAGTPMSAIIGLPLHDKLVGIFKRHHQKKKLNKMM